MSTEEHITQLTAQITALQAQLARRSWSPPPAIAQPSAAPPPPPKPPKVSTPSPFSGAQDDLDRFKAKCSLYLSMRCSEFPDERSNALFILSYMKGGSAGPWATQKINSILFDAQEVMWAGFIEELDEMFADPNCQATARRKLATLRQGDSSVEELIREFEIHGPISGLGDIGLIDHFEQAIHPQLRESIYHLEPMPTTWLEWKCKASLLDNQWRQFRDTQPKAATNQMFSFCPPPSHHLNCHHHILLLSTPRPCCILSPPTHRPGSHRSNEERPSSWSLLQLWQARPHRKGLPRTTHPECPECQCYDDSETCSQGLAVPRRIPEGNSNSICAHDTSG